MDGYTPICRQTPVRTLCSEVCQTLRAFEGHLYSSKMIKLFLVNTCLGPVTISRYMVIVWTYSEPTLELTVSRLWTSFLRCSSCSSLSLSVKFLRFVVAHRSRLNLRYLQTITCKYQSSIPSCCAIFTDRIGR